MVPANQVGRTGLCRCLAMKIEEDPKIREAKAKLRRIAEVSWNQKQKVNLEAQLNRLSNLLEAKRRY